MSLFCRIYTESYYSTSRCPPCVRATTLLFSRGKYTHPSIILLWTGFHYGLRNKKLTHTHNLHLFSADDLEVKFTVFSTIIRLLPISSGRNEKKLVRLYFCWDKLQRKKRPRQDWNLGFWHKLDYSKSHLALTVLKKKLYLLLLQIMMQLRFLAASRGLIIVFAW